MRANLRVITKKLQKSRKRRSSRSCQNYEKMMKTLLLQNQQMIIQQQNMMFMVMKQYHPQAPDQSSTSMAAQTHAQSETGLTQLHSTDLMQTNHFNQHTQNQLSSQQQQHILQPLHETQPQQQHHHHHQHQQQLGQHHSDLTQASPQSAVVTSRSHANTTTTTTIAGHQQLGGNMLHDQHHHHHHHHDENSLQHHHHQSQQQQQSQLSYTHHQINGSQSSDNNQHQLQQVGTPAHLHSENIATAYLTPVASEQDPISDKPDDDDITALLGGDDLLTSNLLYNPQTDIGQITPYKSQQTHQQTPSYYSSGAESLTTPRVEQQQPRQPSTANINQNVVKNLADSFKSPSKPKINVQILSGSATRNMKNNKAKIIQRMNISEFLRHVHQDDQAQQQQPLKSSATQ